MIGVYNKCGLLWLEDTNNCFGAMGVCFIVVK